VVNYDPFVPGSEVAGVVRQAPAGAPVNPGDRLAAFPGLGGFAEVVATDSAMVFPTPERVSFQTAAAVSMNYLTVHCALTRRGGLHEGEAVLVHGPAGGIGTAAVQMAAALGARVVTVASTPEKAEVATAAGAQHTVSAENFRAHFRAFFRSRSPGQRLATAAPWTSPWFPARDKQNFGKAA
jgi:NADPH:quinone reductase